MTKHETLKLIADNRLQILAEMRECYNSCIRSDGAFNYLIYIWSDGTLETLERTDCNTWLQANRLESRELVRVCCVDVPGFNWIDFCSDTLPEEPWYGDYDDDCAYESAMTVYNTQIDRMHCEVIDSLISEYDESEELDNAIRNIECFYDSRDSF